MESARPEKIEDQSQASNDTRFYLIYALIVVGGILLRWLNLDQRPMHHDESLHAMFGRYFFDFPDHNYYKYDPMMHGPFIYNVLRLVYNTLGSTTWAARSLTAMLGSLLIFAPLIFRRHLSRDALLALTAVISLSPTLIYWSRFIREDTLQLFSMFIALSGVLLFKGGQKVFFVVLGITLQFCIKENSYVTHAILIGYLVFELLFNNLIMSSKDSLLASMFTYLRKHWASTVVAIGVCAFLYCYLYTAGFRYQDGILDGLYRKSIMYWWDQHEKERIVGPFLFHFYVLSWYEFLFIVAFFYHTYTFYKKAPKGFRVVGGVVALITTLCVISNWGAGIEKIRPWSDFKLKDEFDLIGLFVFVTQSLMVTIYHLSRREKALAFWGYFFTANLFTYSYLGEKVPWLSVYPFVPGLVYFVLLLGCALLLFHDLREAAARDRRLTLVEIVVHALGAASLLVILFPEFFFLNDSYGGENERMNTIFKFYSASWFMLHIYALWVLKRALEQLPQSLIQPMPRTIIIAASLVFLCGFGVRTISLRRSSGPVVEPRVQGLSAIEQSFQGAATAIQLLSKAPPGVVLEAQGNPYSNTTHVATLSGQQAYLGWSNHVGLLTGQHDEVGRRERFTESVYQEPDCAKRLALINEANIKYLVVGPLEKQRYAEINTHNFSCFSLLIESGQYRIYTVL